jgi:hypothetical protein
MSDVCEFGSLERSQRNFLANQPTSSRWRSAPKLMNLIFHLSFGRIVLPVNGIFRENSRLVSDGELPEALRIHSIQGC